MSIEKQNYIPELVLFDEIFRDSMILKLLGCVCVHEDPSEGWSLEDSRT